MVKQIKNRALEIALRKVEPSLGDIILVKDSDNDYFYITSNDDTWADRISGLYYNHILVHAFKDLTIDEWVDEILDVLLQDEYDYEDWQYELRDSIYGANRVLGYRRK